MSNADRIRHMTDEELADFLFCIDTHTDEEWLYEPWIEIHGQYISLEDSSALLEWLRESAADGLR